MTVQVKYVNGMPLYRQEKDWLQYGFELSRATMANWVIECTDKYLRVLYEFYHRLLLSRGFAMADESHIQVLKEERREARRQNHMLWVERDGLSVTVLKVQRQVPYHTA